MSRYNPRNRNEPTHDAPKSTARWFDERCKGPKHSIGFLVNTNPKAFPR